MAWLKVKSGSNPANEPGIDGDEVKVTYTLLGLNVQKPAKARINRKYEFKLIEDGLYLPDSITIIMGDRELVAKSSLHPYDYDYTYSQLTGFCSINNLTDDTQITAFGASDMPDIYSHSFMFESQNATVSLSYRNYATAHWDGILQYSFDGIDWYAWDGTEINNENIILLRGRYNTVITGNYNPNSTPSASCGFLVTSTTQRVLCWGYLENLLDYVTVSQRGVPSIGSACFAHLFDGCDQLVSPDSHDNKYLVIRRQNESLAVPSSEYCCAYMFRGCNRLTRIYNYIDAHFDYADNYAFDHMFYGCASITDAELYSRVDYSSIPANQKGHYAYSYMYASCPNLTEIKWIPLYIGYSDYCCYNTFADCTSLVTVCTMETGGGLGQYCFSHMFAGCTSLITAPEFHNWRSTHRLGVGCFEYMYFGCTSLVAAVSLPYTSLTSGCYRCMFKGCTSLRTASSLPAMTTMPECYMSMYEGCTSLTTIPRLPANVESSSRPALMQGCYEKMFYGCTSVKVSETQTGEYVNEFRVPTSGQIQLYLYSAVSNIIWNTGGTYEGDPLTRRIDVNTTYYTSNALV